MVVTRKMFLMLAASMMAFAIGMGGCASNEESSGAAGSQEPVASALEDAGAEEPVTLQIFAANSLTKAMAEAQELYTSQHPNVTFADTQFEGSGTLVEMLAAGQYADLLITASQGTMDEALEKGLVDAETESTMFTNELLVVTKKDGSLTGRDITLEDIAAGDYTVAVGDESVPAGNYAAQALSTVGAYAEPDGAIGAEATGKGGTWSATLLPKISFGAKVGDVCKYAESGEVDIALVYSSDVYRMGGMSICSTVPGDTHRPITYPGALCAGSEQAEAAAAFLAWCMTDEDCIQIWERWGFEIAA